MGQDIKFHCRSEDIFKNDNQLIRAFTYTDYSITEHNHDFYEMNIVLSGSGIHKMENRHISVSAGDVFVIPPMIAHAYYDTKNLDVYHILFQKKFILNNHSEAAAFPGFLQLTEIEPYLRQNFLDSMFLHLSQTQLLQVKEDLSFIDDASVFSRDEFAAARNHAAWKILYRLSYLFSRQTSSGNKKSPKRYEQSIIRALEYIHLHYGEKITLESLCNISFLSRSTFLRSFSNICGCTPAQYLNRYRLSKASELMENSSMSKTEIAHHCGFYDLSHMERMSKNTGIR